MEKHKKLPPAKIRVENASILIPGDLDDLCDSTELAIIEGGGFGWINVPSRKILENYWKGVIAIPERELIIGRLDNLVAGSCQIIKPSKNNEAQKDTCLLTTFFLAPWARGYGISPKLIVFAEEQAIKYGFSVITLDVRETQNRAIEIYEKNGYKKFGENPFYATVENKYVKGIYYYKTLKKNESIKYERL